MALLHMQFFSKTLGKQTSVQIILPDDALPPYRTLYLLHGWSDDHSAWLRNTTIEQQAKREQIAVVMPDVALSYYTDMVHGGHYFTYLSQELPHRMEREFPLSSNREDRFVAGLSMGGFGAFKWALHMPQQFAAAASFSGALLVEELLKLHERTGNHARQPLMQAIFGSELNVTASGGDLLLLLQERVGNHNSLPFLYQYCGTEDFIYEINLHFRKQAREIGAPLTYKESPGDHSWDYWENCVNHWFSQLHKDGLL